MEKSGICSRRLFWLHLPDSEGIYVFGKHTMKNSSYLDRPKRSLEEALAEKNAAQSPHPSAANEPGRSGRRTSLAYWLGGAFILSFCFYVIGVSLFSSYIEEETLTAEEIRLLNDIIPAAGGETGASETGAGETPAP